MFMGAIMGTDCRQAVLDDPRVCTNVAVHAVRGHAAGGRLFDEFTHRDPGSALNRK